MTEKALKGVKVLEFCTKISGAYATKLMADLGADVIKIENPISGDEVRRKGPFPNDVPHPDGSGQFFYLNTNKRGITLDPEKPTGKTIFQKLVTEMDILVEDTLPGKMEEMKLDYEHLKKLNPGLIMTSLTPYGLSGPYKDYKAKYLNTSHSSGQGYGLPLPAMDDIRPPVMIGGNKGGYDAGVNAALAMLAAYFWKGLSGKGQFIEISRQEGLISMQRVEATTFPNDGFNMSRQYFRRNRFIGGVIRCKNGYVTLLTPQEHQWQSLVKLMRTPDWTQEEFCKDAKIRMQNVAKVNDYLDEWVSRQDRDELVAKGQAVGCPVSPVNNAEDIVHSKQFEARGFFTDIDHPQVGKIKFPTSPYRFSKTPWKLERFAPRHGEHNYEIFCDQLGYKKEDLVKFKAAGII